MQVILLERVEKLGTLGDVVKVKDGFARNYLLPRAKALRATSAGTVTHSDWVGLGYKVGWPGDTVAYLAEPGSVVVATSGVEGDMPREVEAVGPTLPRSSAIWAWRRASIFSMPGVVAQRW